MTEQGPPGTYRRGTTRRVHIMLNDLSLTQLDALQLHYNLRTRNAAIVFAIAGAHLELKNKGAE